MPFESCTAPSHYYAVIEVQVGDDGHYILGSDSMIDLSGSLYQDQFDLVQPNVNRVTFDENSGCHLQFKLSFYFQKQRRYFLVVTTPLATITGSFSVYALGAGKVILKDPGEYIYPSIQLRVRPLLSSLH